MNERKKEIIRFVLDHPELLETPPESVKFDFDGKYEYHVPKVKKAE